MPNWKKVIVSGSDASLNSLITATFVSASSLQIDGSGSTLLSVDGSSGRLFSVTDDLSDSLFSANTIAGLPVLEVFSDNTVKIGTFNDEAIIVNGNTAEITGSVFGTSSYSDNSDLLDGQEGSYYLDFSNHTNKPTLISGSAEGDSQGQIKLNGQNVNTNNLGTDDSPSFAGLTVDTNTLYVDSTNNRVGIGTTSPGSNLDVEDVSGVVFRLSNPANGGTSTIVSTGYDSANVERFSSAIDFQSVAGNSTSNGHIIFSTYPSNTKTERMRIDSDGNVGIGITNPSAKLDISAGTNLNLGVRQLSTDNFSNDGIGITFSRTSSDADLMALGVTDTDKLTLLSRSGIIFATSGSVAYGQTSEKMRIDSDGNVGIGTNSPAAHLHINGDGEILRLEESSSTGNPYLSFYQNGTRRSYIQHLDSDNQLRFASEYGAIDFRTGDNNNESTRMYIDSSGNVGIGTTSPTGLLDLESSSTTGTQLHLVNTSTGGTDWRLISAGSANSISAGYFGIYNSTWRMVVDDSGNVGIGTTSPSTKLEVNGTATVTALVETSTRELKDKIQPLNSQKEVIKKLKPSTYIWKESGEEDFGLIAEDVEEIAPHLVHRDSEGKPSGIKYSKLSVLLLDVVQRQNTLIEDLNKRITKLENERG